MDFINRYVMGSIEMLTGFYYLTVFLKRKVKPIYGLLFVALGIVMISVVPEGSIMELLAYVLLLTVGGVFFCRANGWPVILYAVLIVEIMRLSYGMVNSLLSILYPLMPSLDRRIVGIAFMILGNMALLVAVLFYRMAYWYFSYDETIKKQYLLMALIPISLIFFMEEYIGATFYGGTVTGDNAGGMANANHYQMFAIQLLGMASLFYIMYAFKKLLENFRLGTELFLLEQEERFLNQYVEEAKARYEKTKSFRHDIKNHMTVVKELLQKGKPKQALDYIGDMEGMVEELSFPCSTNHPAADIVVGNKLGMAKGMGIEAYCSLFFPYPCFVRSIDLCIILANALDNAIHACQGMDPDAEKYIRVTGRIQGDFIFMEIENSFQGKGFSGEGTGLANIKSVAEKYRGTISIKTQGTAFFLSVLLIIPQHPESI